MVISSSSPRHGPRLRYLTYYLHLLILDNMVTTRSTRPRVVGEKHPVSEDRGVDSKRATHASPPPSPVADPDAKPLVITQQHIAPLYTTSEVKALLSTPGARVAEYDQKNILHQAILEEWDQDLVVMIMRHLDPCNRKNFLAEKRVFRVAPMATLLRASTPAFWKTVTEEMPDTNLETLVYDLSFYLGEEGHLLFTRETWEVLFNLDSIGAPTAIVEAYWKSGCYRKFHPGWFIEMVLKAAVSRQLLTPFHYYSVTSRATGATWRAKFPGELARVRRELVDSPAASSHLLLDLVTVGLTHRICDLPGFEEAHSMMSPRQRGDTDADGNTGLRKLELAWDLRSRVKYLLFNNEHELYPAAIARMRLLEPAV